MSENDKRYPNWPRGLSRSLSSLYIGVSTGLFDQLVKDGRMPPPKHINARRVWDRILLDTYFNAIDGDATAPGEMTGRDFDAENDGYERRKQEREAKKNERLRLLNPAPYEAWDKEGWEREVRASRLWKREKEALSFLYSRKPEIVPAGEIKAGPATMQRLEAREYVLANPATYDRCMPNYSITAMGEAAWVALLKP